MWYTWVCTMFNLGFGEILVICVILIIVVGPERLPTLMKNVGKGMRTVREASREIRATVGFDEMLREDARRPRPKVTPPAATAHRAPAVTATPVDTATPTEQAPAAPLPDANEKASPPAQAREAPVAPPAPSDPERQGEG